MRTEIRGGRTGDAGRRGMKEQESEDVRELRMEVELVGKEVGVLKDFEFEYG